MRLTQKTTLSALFVSFMLVSAASAQTDGIPNCGVALATNCSGSTGMRACSFRRNIGTGAGMATSCAVTMSNNANCTLTMATMYIHTFNAVQTGPNPSCQWSCSACPTVTLDTADGLPVELLEFDIEDGDTEQEQGDGKGKT